MFQSLRTIKSRRIDMRCPNCGIWIRRKAKKCWRCRAVLKDDAQVTQYITQCLNRIEREFLLFEQMINDKRGLIFRRYRYSYAELLECEHVAKIKSIVTKMSDDIENWSNHERISTQTRCSFAIQAEEISRRLDILNAKIHNRRPTGFEKVCEFISSCSHFLRTILLPFLASSVKLRITQTPIAKDSSVKTICFNNVRESVNG